VEAKEGVEAEAAEEKKRGEGKSMLGAVRRGEKRAVRDEPVQQFEGQVPGEELVLLLVAEETVHEGVQAEPGARSKKKEGLAEEKSVVGRRIGKKTFGLSRHSQGRIGGKIVPPK